MTTTALEPCRACAPPLPPMRYFVRRRLTNAAVTLAALGLVTWQTRRLELALRPSAFFTGWILLAIVAFCALYNIRKRFPALPIGSSAAWLQGHVYAALASAGVLALHAPLRWPNGWLEGTLFALYAATMLSGVVGLYWTRTLPRRLSRVSEEVIYERIPMLRGQLRDRAHNAVLTAVKTAGATTLGEFYRDRLHDFFERRRGWGYRLYPTMTRRKLLLAALTEATRYFTDAEREIAEHLFSLVRRRDELDFHESLQWRLRAWLFVHIGLTLPLLLTAALHAWLAHAYDGSGA